ncbi:NADP-dependent oxidoreductase [Amycolatopsis sp. NPDC059657]|uniref:NADP-dependent oxidoreductase n=1 Tax=Amycolatopsis sp. NPDC059657 TaxID=3346899 RepID=UPI00366E0E9C
MKMRAVSQSVFGGPEVLEMVEVDRPAPGDGEVVVKVHAVAVNPADWRLRSGQIRYFGEPPFTLGCDVSGVVAATGPGADKFEAGDEVFGMLLSPAGAYAEYVVLAQDSLTRKPKSLDHVHAAALPVAALTAWQGLAKLRSGDRVLIQAAAGGVGHLAVQFARERGATVIGTARAAKHEFLRDLGADQLIDYTTEDFTKIEPVDVVLDLVGGDVAQPSLELVKPGGVFVDALGSDQLAAQPGYFRLYCEANGDELAKIAELVDAGTVKVHVEKVLPLDKVAEAHRLVETGRTTGKIVLTP